MDMFGMGQWQHGGENLWQSLMNEISAILAWDMFKGLLIMVAVFTIGQIIVSMFKRLVIRE